MKTLIVYDSVFGNTERVAQTMGAALGEDVAVLRVGEVAPGQLTDLDVLLVGSPTRAFRPTPAVKGWLQSLARGGLHGVKVAAFDTRMDMAQTNSPILRFFVKLFGYAAAPMAARLVKKGGEQAMPPEGFFVEGSEGPLRDGELERAAAWAQRIVAEE